MAQGKKYTDQFAFVGTATQGAIVKAAAEQMGIDKAPIVREVFNRMVGLGPDDELVSGDTVEAATARLIEIMTPAEPAPTV